MRRVRLPPAPQRLTRLTGGLPADIVTMAGVSFCVALGFGIVAPAIPLFASQFGVSATAAGFVVSAFALMRLLSGLAAGKLVDLIGGRTSLVIGLAVVAVSSLLAGLSASYPQLLVLRGIGGVGSAVFAIAAITIVLRVATAQTRGRAMSVYRTGFLVGGVVGPGLGGAVLGISLRAPFFLYAGTLGLAGVVALAFLTRRAREGDPDPTHPGERPEHTDEPDPDQHDADEPTLRAVLATREYQAALTANLSVGLAVFGVRSTVVPLLIVQGLGAEPFWVGTAFLVQALVQTALMFPAGRWADTAGRRPALVTGGVVSAAGLLVLGISDGVGNAGTAPLVVALAGMVVFGAGAAFLGSVPGALVGDVAGRRSGTIVAVFNMASDVGAVVGPTVAGWLVDQGSFLAAFGLAAGVVLAAGVLGLRLRAPQVPRTEAAR